MEGHGSHHSQGTIGTDGSHCKNIHQNYYLKKSDHEKLAQWVENPKRKLQHHICRTSVQCSVALYTLIHLFVHYEKSNVLMLS
jgi:hypothetical protein